MDMEKYEPTRGKILGLILEEETRTSSGLYLVSNLKTKKPRRVKVLAVGEPSLDEQGNEKHYHVCPGQVAYFRLAKGEKIRVRGKTYLVLENEDVVAVED